MPTTDNELLQHWDQDPGNGFRLIYERYSGVLLRFVFRFTANQEQAEEILQDIFIELLSVLKKRDSQFNLKAWLLAVARNKSLNFEKKKKREILSEDKIAAAVDPEIFETQVSDSQLIERLKSYQDFIPQELAQTWNLRRQGLDYQEIADHLHIPIGTVKSRFSRLVEFFRKEFKLEDNR